MPAAGILAALMKEWPLNNVMLSTATYSKLREALDGTDTQVATCKIDRWMAKMKGAEEYITREISGREKRLGRHQKALVVQYQRRRRRTHPRTRPEDGLWPSPQLRRWRSCSPTILPDRWRSPRKSPVLKPASLPNSLYWACWVWVRSHLQWKTPPQIGTLQIGFLIHWIFILWWPNCVKKLNIGPWILIVQTPDRWCSHYHFFFWQLIRKGTIPSRPYISWILSYYLSNYISYIYISMCIL